MDIRGQASFVYFKQTKHRKRCRACRKLIQDGELAFWQKVRLEKSYPVKGLMWFIRNYFWHRLCWIQHTVRPGAFK